MDDLNTHGNLLGSGNGGEGKRCRRCITPASAGEEQLPARRLFDELDKQKNNDNNQSIMGDKSSKTLSYSEISALRRAGSGLGNLLSINDRELLVAMRLISWMPTGRLVLTRAGMRQIAKDDAWRNPSSEGTGIFSGARPN
jgi:hypothetical protein